MRIVGQRLETMTSLGHLTPSRKDLILNYFSKEKESWQIIDEYLEVALSFATLGALLARHLKDNDARLDPLIQHEAERDVLRAALTNAMERIRELADKVQISAGKRRGDRVAHPQENQTLAELKTEMTNAFIRLGMEDTVAAKSEHKEVYHIESTRKVGGLPVEELEQQGRTDRKRMTVLRIIPQSRFDRPSVQKFRSMSSAEEATCINCRRKERYMIDLKETLHEKDVFMMAITEEANLERQERKKLDAEIVTIKGIVGNLKKRLASEVQEREAAFRRHAEEAIRLKEKLKEAEIQLEMALLEISSLKKKLRSLVRASRRGEALNRMLKRRMSELQSPKDRISSGMERRNRAESENLRIEHRKPALRRRLAYEEDKTKHTGIIKERPREMDHLKYPIGNSAEKNGENADMEKRHSIEVENKKSTFKKNIMELENRVKYLQEKVRVLESSALQGINGEEQNYIGSREKMKNINEASSSQSVHKGHESHSLWKLRDMAGNKFQLSATKHLLAQQHEREKELEKWKKLYMAAKTTIDLLQSGCQNNIASSKALARMSSDYFDNVQNLKGRQAAEWEQHHSYERIASERQMRVKDERLEALRQQLLRMEKEATKNQKEINMLKENLRST